MQQDVTVLEIDWTEAIGTTGSVGSPYLFGWLRAAYIRPGMIADGRIVVLARTIQSENWYQYQGLVSEPEAATLICMLAGLGIPDRPPRLETIYDTSDTLHTCMARVVVAQQTQTFTVETQCSGFQGEDAPGLREVFLRILDLVGHGYHNTIFEPTSVTKR